VIIIDYIRWAMIKVVHIPINHRKNPNIAKTKSPITNLKTKSQPPIFRIAMTLITKRSNNYSTNINSLLKPSKTTKLITSITTR